MFPPITKQTIKPHEKENMTDFIEKKRKMFLIQMSLDTKKFEVKKLEKKAEERERSLQLEEQALMRDAQKFDEFLTENDMQAVEAMNDAENETKQKQAKQNEIKKLNTKISAVKNEIVKLDEQLENCKRYKAFLDKLTPESFRQQQKEKRQKLIEEKAYDANQKLAPARRNSGSNRPTVQRTASSSKIEAVTVIPEIEDDMEEYATEMYFTNPEQLLHIFSDLEENNLFLIQNSQDYEEQLEEIKKQYRETKKNMDNESANLKSQIDKLEEQIAQEEEKSKVIKLRAKKHTDEESIDKLTKLKAKIKEIYEEAGFEIPLNDDSDPLHMLTQIESKLEELLNIMASWGDPLFIQKLERQREKERRKNIRDERTDKLKQQQKERKHTNLKKSQEGPVKKKVGKPLMFRSPPIEVKKKTSENKTESETEQRDEFKELFS
ncbi:coiled-coil domain-containing protein [Acrasis kona]|uniref:Coiled-coil domain-containing protein n=1 Tax=Acrasis kona TaxID=1008807 RepID=A0AAW2ZQ68_9EUKA